ncbi:ABC transporter ATP-binding protein [Ruminococcus sp. XPD3002]|uniref:ABC transporter ATP-binding protein n=1 Tax=Ruminococcus sp. XPD3002 TaxID=1452269 RepID=UPI00091D95D5|nr:ATP-binding cassette, subfamily B [Ruminococcus flavefaciens]
MEKNEKIDVMKIIDPYARKCKGVLTLGRLLAALSAFVALIPFYDIWKILKVALNGGERSEMSSLGWQAVILTAVSMALYICALWCTHVAAMRVQANMRSSLMRRILTLPLGVFDQSGTGKLRRIFNGAASAVETYIAHNLPDKAAAAATPIGLLVLFVIFDWKLGLVCLIPVILAFACMMRTKGKVIQQKMSEYQNALDVMSSEATEYVRGISVVKIFGQSVDSFRRFKKAIDDYSSWSVTYTKLMRPSMVGYLTFVNAIFAFIVAAAFVLIKGEITTDIILNFTYYIIVTPLLTVTLSKIAYSGEQEMTLIDALRRISGILEIEPLPDAESKALPKDDSITLDNVKFRYKEDTDMVLRGLSLDIRSGEHIALVGPSGGGKSTAAALISRFFDVTEGAIYVGGVNIKDIPQKELMKKISFVFQNSNLLKTSILENVRLARPEASEEEVMKALEAAQCMDIINKLPNGIHTVIGAKGTYLSGGEKQRITIARAILKNAPIIILDEATAFADPDNEALVQAAMEELSKGKTLIMIAHRLSTVTNADRIYVLNEGVVAESGSHEELMQKNGIYAKMFDEYTRSAEWRIRR